MFENSTIADELAGIRSQIKALKAREQMLREVVLSDPSSHAGKSHDVVIKRHQRRVLRHDKLPSHILNNPRYWDLREVPQVTLRERAVSDVVDLNARRAVKGEPLAAPKVAPRRAVRPGDPVAERPKAPVLRLVAPEAEHSDVLEAFAG